MIATYMKLLLTALFWGGTFIAGRMLGPHIDPFSAGFLRFATASAILLGLTARTGQLRLPRRQEIVPVLLLGLTGIFLYNILFFQGLKSVAAGRAALIVAMNPVMISLFSAWIYGEKLTPAKGAGIALCFTGAAVVITRGDPAALLAGGVGLGELCILGCVLSWTAYSLVGKRAMRTLSPMAAVTMSCTVGAILLLPPAMASGLAENLAHYPGTVWGCVLYLGLFGTAIGFNWFYQGIQRLGPARAGVFINFVPISAVFLAWIILREPVDGSLLAGMALVGTGVYLTNRVPGALAMAATRAA